MVEEAARKPDGDAAIRLQKALSIIQDLSPQSPQDNSPLHSADPYVQIFSDSVILSIAPHPPELKNLFLVLSRLFVQLMIQGVWIRGGISFGKFSTNPITPCGPAVNSAYQIESKIARFPRLALSASMVAFCRKHDHSILESAYIQRDEDGVFAISPLNLATEQHEEFGMDIRVHATEIRDRLDEALEEIVDRPDQFQKVKELAERWNFIADHKKDFFKESYRTKGYIDFVDVFNAQINFDIDALPPAP